MAKKISDRHKQVLKVIQKHSEKYGYSPSYRDICEDTEITSTSMVNYYLKQLEEEGYVKREENISRSLNVTEKARRKFQELLGTAQDIVNDFVKSLSIPIVGKIVASKPVPVPSGDFSHYDYESAVDIAESLVPRGVDRATLFALEVKGDSMIDAMVNDGDIVIMKPAQEAANGEMVAVRINQDETTLKYFYREDDRVRLQPANPTMDPIYVEKSTPIEVQGQVVLVLRQV
ncbi:MAG: transcriptional repressor LexA [Chloroflexota bacterium]|nr:transcriptional repressor LexA [Chloroflexota bacterium]